jgi:anti-anti-sigma regulatory factor/HAMP domain-containing protein
MSFGHLRLATQLAILVITMSLISLAVVVLILLTHSQALIGDAIVARNKEQLETTARQMVDVARHSNIIAARLFMSPIPRPGSVRRVALYSANGLFLVQETARDVPVSQGGGDEALAREAILRNQIVERRAPSMITLVAPVRAEEGDAPSGALAMDLPTDDIERQLAALRLTALVVGGGMALTMALATWSIARSTLGPIQTLTRAVEAFGRGELGAPIEPQQRGELGTLARTFRRMADDLQVSRAAIEEQNHALERRVAERTIELEQALAELREAATAREQLSAAVREMSSPVVPVLEGILVMPLIGVIDAGRAGLLVRSLLEGIERHQADVVILDVTGVPLVDTQVARALLEAAHAARLLGARPVLVGLRPELAQTIVSLGLDLSSLVTRADLQIGVDYAIKLRQNSGLQLVTHAT